MRTLTEITECEAGHKLAVERDADGHVVAAALREGTKRLDKWSFIDVDAFCPQCGADID